MSGVEKPEPGRASVVIFGASGDLAQRKLLPSLYNLFRRGRLSDQVQVWGASRSPWTDTDFRERVRAGAQSACGTLFDEASWERFAARLRYRPAEFGNMAHLAALDEAMSAEGGTGRDSRLYYLATPPAQFPDILRSLALAGMGREDRGFRRVIIEKPFGTDLESARRLNAVAHEGFREDQVYRIDHYLAKETVQSLLAFRFANVLFEPVWNRTHVEGVHVLVAESIGVAGRAGYYEQAGVLRDMFQNHLLQLLTLVAMEPPARAEAESLRNEKVKVLQCVKPLPAGQLDKLSARGQYEGYRTEQDASPESNTATYGIVRLHVDDWRWSGVPFILESGKGLKSKVTEVVVRFRRPPLRLFRGGEAPNSITFRIQPDEGVHLTFQTKEPGEGMRLRPVEMDFSLAESFHAESVWDAYERLLLDALEGNASLFMRSDEIEQAWRIMDPIIAGWDTPDAPPLELYRKGSWGPPGAERVRGGLAAPPAERTPAPRG